MSKHRNVAITEVAKQAARQLGALTAWEAVEIHAKRILNATKEADVTGDFAELHFRGASVQGVVKVGNVVMKIEA